MIENLSLKCSHNDNAFDAGKLVDQDREKWTLKKIMKVCQVISNNLELHGYQITNVICINI